MSFDLVMCAFNDGAVVPADRARVRRAMTGARGNTMQDYWQKHFDGTVFETALADGGTLQIRLPPGDPTIDRVELTPGTLSADTCNFICKIGTEGGIALFNPQGRDTPESPVLIAFGAEQRVHVRWDGYEHVAVATSGEELAALLGMSRDEWERYRSQVVGAVRPPPAEVADLKAFIDVAASALPPTHVKRLRNAAITYSNRMHTTDAIHEAFTELDTAKRWIFMSVDLREAAEVVAQGNAMARTRGVKQVFEWTPAPGVEGSQTHAALLAYDTWLAERGLRFVLWNLNEEGPPDDFRGFVVPAADVGSLLAKASAARLRCGLLSAAEMGTESQAGTDTPPA